jgi:hypothetical protein
MDRSEEFEIYIDWLKSIKKKTNYIENLLLINLAFSLALISTSENYEAGDTAFFWVFVVLLFIAVRWAYRKISTWWTYRKAYKVLEVIAKESVL